MKVPGPSWVLPLLIGILSGAAVEWGVTGRSAVGGWLVLAAPVATALVTLVAAVVGALIPSAVAERAELRQRVRDHVESLTTKAYAWLPTLSFQSDRWELPRPSTRLGGLMVGNPNGQTARVDQLSSWGYAEAHLLQDPKVGVQWRRISDRVAGRDRLRVAWAELFRKRLEQGLSIELLGEWTAGSGFGTPQPENWYESATIWNWLQSRGQLGDFVDGSNVVAYNNIDYPNETRYTVASRSVVLLSSRNPGVRAEKLLKLLTALQSDPEVEEARKKVAALDDELATAAVELRGDLREFFERTSETGRLTGKCGVCR